MTSFQGVTKKGPSTMLRTAFLISLLATGAHTSAQAWELSGFDMPESIVTDAANNQLFVSNIAGHPAEADGNGYVSRVSADGTLLDLEWATGMDAPKGMALFGDSLIVADLTKLHVVSRATGQITQTLHPEGAVFLNDVTASADRVWISDMMTGVIWAFDGSSAKPFYQAADLPHPNGLWTDGTDLVIAHWGPGMQADFTTEAPGDLLSVDIASGDVSTISAKLGNLDGVDQIEGGFVVSDWLTGEIFKVTGDESALLLKAPVSTADISVQGDTLYLPHMFEGRISTFDLN